MCAAGCEGGRQAPWYSRWQMTFWHRASLFVFVTALPVFGSSVSVSCDPDTAPPPSYDGFLPPPTPLGLYASCNGLNPDGSRASASAQVYLSLSTTGGYNILSVNSAGSAVFPGLGGSSAVSQSTTEFAEYLQSAGPVRAGYLEVLPNEFSGIGAGFGTDRFNVSISSGSSLYPPVLAGADNVTPTFPYSLYNNPDGSPKLVPTLLGVPLLLSGMTTASAAADFSDGSGAGRAIVNYGFRFFEADGTTPVAVSETPEPSTLLLGIPVLGAFLLRRRA